MTEAEVFSLSITNPKGRRTGAFDWLTDQWEANKEHSKFTSNILANLCSISHVNNFFSSAK